MEEPDAVEKAKRLEKTSTWCKDGCWYHEMRVCKLHCLKLRDEFNARMRAKYGA